MTHFSDVTNFLGGSLGGAAGQYGVMLFFMLSGFLMAHLYLEKEFNRKNLYAYFLARMGRILPLYLLVVFISYCSSNLGTPVLYEIVDLNVLVSHLLFVDGESVLWTIPVEIQFYLLFILFWYFSSHRPGYIYVTISAILILLFFTNFPRLAGDFNGVTYNFFRVIRSLPYFFIGIIFGMHYKSGQVPSYLRKHRFMFALALIPLMYPQLSPITSDAKIRMWLSYEVLFVMSTVFFCVVFLVPQNNIFLSNRLGDFIGKISYSLYLLHLPIILKVDQFDLPVEQKLFFSFFLSIIAASVSYQYFEKPAAKLLQSKFSAR